VESLLALLIQPGKRPGHALLVTASFVSPDFSKLRRRSVPDYQYSGTILALIPCIKDRPTVEDVEVGGAYTGDK
jgi:hypothetical protein